MWLQRRLGISLLQRCWVQESELERSMRQVAEQMGGLRNLGGRGGEGDDRFSVEPKMLVLEVPAAVRRVGFETTRPQPCNPESSVPLAFATFEPLLPTY